MTATEELEYLKLRVALLERHIKREAKVSGTCVVHILGTTCEWCSCPYKDLGDEYDGV